MFFPPVSHSACRFFLALLLSSYHIRKSPFCDNCGMKCMDLRLEMHFSIDYTSDYRKAQKLILELINANPLALDKPEKPFVTMCEHAESSIKLLTRVWVKSSDYWDLNFQLLEQVKEKFDENGITIPLNKLDVRVHNQ